MMRFLLKNGQYFCNSRYASATSTCHIKDETKVAVNNEDFLLNNEGFLLNTEGCR